MEDHFDADQLISAADDALYQAKREGRIRSSWREVKKQLDKNPRKAGFLVYL